MDGMGMELEYIKVYPASNPGWNGWMDGMDGWDGWDGMHFFMYPYTHQSALSCCSL